MCKLGTGGMGEVYRARDPKLKRDVAIKVLPADVADDSERLARFQREAEVLASLNHPNIAHIYGVEDRALVMELVEGRPLSDLITAGGMDLSPFLDIALPLADALTAAHQKLITHRDLKPGNIMIGIDGRVKVLDFGLARVGGDTPSEQTMIATQAPITQRGVIVGTMPYMSPEQIEGRAIDARSDLFSLGVIFFELLSGERPFKGDSSPSLMSAILRDAPSAIIAKRPELPHAIERLVFRMLEKRPDDRVQTARDVFNELRHLRKQVDSQSAPVPAPTPAPSSTSTTLRLAVLPFTVRGADEDAATLAAGLTDDAASSLARFPGLQVVAPQSTRAFKHSELDVREIADRLGARYIVSGSVRKAGSAIRTSAQLIDASNGAQLWSQDYDRATTTADLFSIQDDLTDHIVATVADPYGVLARSMVQAVQARGDVANAAGNDLLVRTWGFQQMPKPEVHAALRAKLEAEVLSDSGNAHLWAELANLYVVEHSLSFNPRPDPLGRALRAARRAVELDRNHQNGWLWQAIPQFHLHDREAFEDAGQRTVRINPRNATAMAWIGNLLTHMGEYDRGCALTERAMAINPAHPGWLHFAVFNRHFGRGEYDQALQAARRSNMPLFFWMHFAIAAAAGQAGRPGEGRDAVDQMVALAPFLKEDDQLREFINRWYWDEDVIERLHDGVRRAAASDAAPQAPASRTSRPPSSSSTRSASTELHSIAISPFVARSNDDESRDLAEGLTDDVTVLLSKFGNLRVVGRGAATQSRFTLEGQVRRSGNMFRISATVLDTHEGVHLWSDHFDRDLSAGMFAVHDEVAARIAAIVGDPAGVLTRAIADAAADIPYDQRSVVELVAAYCVYTEHFRADERARLRDALEKLVQREPRAAEAWAVLSSVYAHDATHHLNPRPGAREQQRDAAQRAVELNPRSQQGWIAMASYHHHARDLGALRHAVDRVVSLNPLNSDLVARAALYTDLSGDVERGAELARQALDNKQTPQGWYHFPIFDWHFTRGEYQEALDRLKAVNLPELPIAHMGAVSVAGYLGRAAEARASLNWLRTLNPSLVEPATARQVWEIWLWSEDRITQLETGFRKAVELVGQP